MNDEVTLFKGLPVSVFLSRREQQIHDEINALDENHLLDSSIEVLTDYFEQKYHLDIPCLSNDVPQIERLVPGARDAFRGMRVAGHLSFTGNEELFSLQPSSYDLDRPRAKIHENTLVLTVKLDGFEARIDPASINQWFREYIDKIKRNLAQLREDAKNFNSSCRNKAKQYLEARRKKILRELGLLASVGFPLVERDDAVRTYEMPLKRKMLPALPLPSRTPFAPEPTLELEHYEHILSVMGNMVLVMERSPKAFEKIQEEDLRWHFLFQLNGHYEEQATGETFNFSGDTDILIRAGGKNIFIAECKFWNGSESLRKTVDQLLGYLSWRDTKTAILLFNRKKDFSNVLRQIPEVIKAHPNFRREVEYDSETGFRYILFHQDDPNRELTLTVLAFEVPISNNWE